MVAVAVVAALSRITEVTAAGVPESPTFVRGGIVVAGPEVEVRDGDGNRLSGECVPLGDRYLLRTAWRAGLEYSFRSRVQNDTARAPRKARPYLVRTIQLEDATRVALTGSSPDSALAFHPNGRYLAIGTFHGWLRVVDCNSGRVVSALRAAEAMVKQVAWSDDGNTLYVGEQGTSGRLRAMRVSKSGDLNGAIQLHEVWSRRLSDDLETSRPADDDRFGIYSLPGVFDLTVSNDGRVFAAGLHSWRDEGELRNLSAIYCIDPEGELLWRFPFERPMERNVSHFGLDPAGTTVAFFAGRSVDTKQSSRDDLVDFSLYRLDGRTGALTAEFEIAPLRPHFQHVESWDSVSVSEDAGRIAIGLGDGRALEFASESAGLRELQDYRLGTPVVVGGLPVAAACSFTRYDGGELFLQTQNTHISFGHPQAADRAPSPHRGANTITVLNDAFESSWRYRGPFSTAGFAFGGRLPAGGGRFVVVTCRDTPGEVEAGQYGCLVFDRAVEGGGSDKLVYYYPTEGPVMFDAAVSRDGQLIAIVESPVATPDRREVYGTYQVHIVH